MQFRKDFASFNHGENDGQEAALEHQDMAVSILLPYKILSLEPTTESFSKLAA